MKTIKNIKTNNELTNELENAGEKVVLLKVSAPWCGPCRVYSKNIELLPQEVWDNLIVLEADAESSDEIVDKFQIRNIPYSILYKNNEIKDKFAGLLDSEKLRKKIININ